MDNNSMETVFNRLRDFIMAYLLPCHNLFAPYVEYLKHSVVLISLQVCFFERTLKNHQRISPPR